MLKKLGMISTLGLLVCVGCSLSTYIAVTTGIINTAVVGALVLTGTALPSLLNAFRGLVPGL